MRKIIHLDLDAFFCAVEELRDPSLHGRAFAVGGRPEERGVVASCSYAARHFGVRSAMPMARAVKLCPGLLILYSRHDEYSRVSQQVMERLHRLTPLVEQISIDEAFLDVSDLPGDGPDLAHQLQSTIQTELHLPCSLGVASNKLVAKIATDVGKAAARLEPGGQVSYPNAITHVPAGQEEEFLAPLPVESLWGVGPKTAARLAEMGVTSIGDLVRYPEYELKSLIGKNGADLSAHARGLDDSPIITSYETKSISQETTFVKDVRDEALLNSTLHELSVGVASRLKQADLSGSTVKIKVRWSDFTTFTRQHTLAQPTDQVSQIYACAVQLFSKEWTKGRPVRLLGVGVSTLRPAVRQLSLFDDPTGREQRLHSAIDSLQQKFGQHILHRGSTKTP